MVLHRSFLLFLMIVVHLSLYAQQLSGYVYDKNTGIRLAYTTISDQSNSRVGNSDKNGFFNLSISNRKIKALTFSHIGYKHQTIQAKDLSNLPLNIRLQLDESQTLQNVEISASPLRQVLTQSYSVTVIDSSLIEEKIATSLIDVLEEVPGITKQAEYHSAIALRGLGGKRLLITEDGNRRMGNFPNGFMGQGVNIYDLAKIEVLKGPASVKYGPGAIAGIINLETKSPFLQPGFHGKALASYGTNNQEQNMLAGINWANTYQAFQFSARYRKANDYTAGKGVLEENSEYCDKDFRIAYSQKRQSFHFTAESELHLGGPWGRPVGFNGTKYMRVYNRIDDTWHSSFSLIWEPHKKLKKVEASVYFDKERRNQIKDSYDAGSSLLSYREDVSYRNYYMGWRGLAVFSLKKNIELNMGTDGVFYRIDSPTQLTDYFLSTVINNKIAKNAGVSLAGVFAEMEAKSMNGRLKIRAGLRGDYSRISEGDVHDTLQVAGRNSDIFAWNGTTSVVYNAWQNIFLSLQVARSCRMPDATEMFIVTSNTDGTVYGNSALHPEYGLNLDAGLRGNLGFCYFDCSLFANFLRNFISLEYWEGSGKKGINYTYLNVDRARIIGAELSVGAKWLHVFHPDNQVTYNGTFVFTQGDKLTDSRGWWHEGVPLRNIPPFNIKQELMLRRMLNSSRSFYLGGDIRYYTTQNRIAPSSDGGYVSPSYCLFGFSAGFTYHHNGRVWNVKLKGDNLADNKYCPFESLSYGMGRNCKLLLTLNF